MKKIGILFGQENTFPPAFVERVNQKTEASGEKIRAEFVQIDQVVQNAPCGYAVIMDRISQDVPFYRAYLKNAALNGTIIVNNPFWWTADDKFLNNGLAERIGVRVPKTVLLPSNQHPPNTTAQSMRNLVYPLNWDEIFEYVGFPAFFKPYAGGGWKNVYKVHGPEELFRIYGETGQLVMMLQEEIVFTEYYRCYCVDRRHVQIMEYDPRLPYSQQYSREPKPIEPSLHEKMEKAILALNQSLGYDLNTVELAIRDGEPYAIDFCNPAPDADIHSVGEANFEWIVEHTAEMCIRKARQYEPGKIQIDWGDFARESVMSSSNSPD